MRHLPVMALVGLSGCSILGTKWEGTWYVQMPVMDPAACETVGDENFDKAEFPDFEIVPTGDWTYTDTLTMSDWAFLVQVMKGKHGEVYVIMDDRFSGTADSKMLTASWEGSPRMGGREEYDADYDYAEGRLNATEMFTLPATAASSTAAGPST
jgi:hypothetical protein